MPSAIIKKKVKESIRSILGFQKQARHQFFLSSYFLVCFMVLEDVQKQSTISQASVICPLGQRDATLSILHYQNQQFIYQQESKQLKMQRSSNQLRIKIIGQFITNNPESIGSVSTTISQQALALNQQNRFTTPIALYYHSRIDKNYENIFLLLTFSIIETKDYVIENETVIGCIFINSPFCEDDRKAINLLNINPFEYLSQIANIRAKMISSVTVSTNISYKISSYIQLKRLPSFIPENQIFSSSHHVCGIHTGYLPNSSENEEIGQGLFMQITIKYLQLQIPEKYEQQVQATLRRTLSEDKTLTIRSRKLICGFHNEYQIVNPYSRKLQFIKNESTSVNSKIGIYECLKESQVIKMKYYVTEQTACSAIMISLIYEFGNRDYQVAFYLFTVLDNAKEDVSELMLTGSGFGVNGMLLPVSCDKKPTIILQYQSKIVQVDEEQQGAMINHSFRKDQRKMSKIMQDNIKREKELLVEELEKERLQLQREKEEMERLRVENHRLYEEEFQKKFELEKANLYRRQEIIEAQYRQQVERELKEKYQLQHEMQIMKVKMKSIEQNASANKSPLKDEPYSSRQQQIQPERDFKLKVSQPQTIVPTIHPPHRIDPSYVLQQQNSINVSKVRSILSKTASTNKQLLRISYEQYTSASKFTFVFSSIIWLPEINPPRTLYFVIRFFNCSSFRTDTLTYISNEEGRHNELIRLNHYVYNYENQQPEYTFIVDPSQYTSPASVQKDLIDYMDANQAILDIFDGETHIYLGQVNVKLNTLIRGSRNTALIAKQYNLVKMKSKQSYGVLQLLIRNEQTDCKEEVMLRNDRRVKQAKRKVISNGPIVIPPQEIAKVSGQTESLKKKASTLNRQQMRISMFKEKATLSRFSASASSFINESQDSKTHLLSKIAQYKSKKLPEYIKGVYEGLLHDNLSISAQFSRTVTVPYIFTNQSSSAASFKISIMEQGNFQELQVVVNASQWRYFARKNNYMQPKMYELINEDNTFYLNPNENIPLVFRYLHLSPTTQKHKTVNVIIMKEDSNWIVGGFTLDVHLQEPIIQHSYVLYEAGEETVDLIIPVLYTDTIPLKTKKLFLTSENSSQSAQWINQYEILLRLVTPQIMHKTTFNLLLYEDDYFDQLRENWLIQVHSYEGVCANTRNDVSSKLKLTLPCSAIPQRCLNSHANVLRLYSSSTVLTFTCDRIELQQCENYQQGGIQIWCRLMGDGTARCIEVTCTTEGDHELVYGWVVRVYPYQPRRN